jgi:TldD protein
MSRSIGGHAPFGPRGGSAIDGEACTALLDEALAEGGDYADLFFEHRATTECAVVNGGVRSAARTVTCGLGVRVVRAGATGFSHTDDLTWESLVDCARSAGRIAAWGPAAAPRGGAPPAGRAGRLRPARAARPFTSTWTEPEPPPVAWRELLGRASDAATREGPAIVSAMASFVDEEREILVATSLGELVFDQQPLLRFVVRAAAERGGRRSAGVSGASGRSLRSLLEERSPESLGREAAAQALRLLEAREGPVGELPVILAAGDGGVLLHEAVGHGLEADFMHRGVSSYSGRLGRRVASSRVTLVDDATLHPRGGALAVDDEGVAPRRTVLIERGELVGTMHDRRTARQLEASPTGNGRRESFRALPLPRMTNTVLLAGQEDPEELFRRVRRGVFARRFGAGQVEVASGDFVFELAESYLVEDGKITAPLRAVTLVGNGPEVMNRVTGLGHDLVMGHGLWSCGKEGQSVPVAVGCPTVLLERVTVGAARGA